MRKSLLRGLFAAAAAVMVAVVLAPTVARAAEGDVVSMYRLYNRYTGEHFYTSVETERDHLVDVGWSYEGIGWQAPVKSDTPVYRLYNGYVTGGDHHYTTSSSERDALVKAGWTNEGIGWYSAPAYPDGDPILRQYNPFAVTGTHNYTASRAERDELTESRGKDFGWTPDGSLIPYAWLDEGIAWYGVKGSTGEDYDARPCNHIIVWGHYVDADGEKWPQCIICGQLFSKLA